MIEVRCTHCDKLLMKSIHQYEACKDCVHIEIKCTKCKGVNCFKIK